MARSDLVLKTAANGKAIVEGSQGLCTLVWGRGRGKRVPMCLCTCICGTTHMHVLEGEHVSAGMCTYVYLHGVWKASFQKGMLRD